MPGIRPDTTGETIYRILVAQADDDGFVDASALRLAATTPLPLRTISGALSRLEQRGRIALIDVGRYVVVHLAERESKKQMRIAV